MQKIFIMYLILINSFYGLYLFYGIFIDVFLILVDNK